MAHPGQSFLVALDPELTILVRSCQRPSVKLFKLRDLLSEMDLGLLSGGLI